MNALGEVSLVHCLCLGQNRQQDRQTSVWPGITTLQVTYLLQSLPECIYIYFFYDFRCLDFYLVIARGNIIMVLFW